MRVSIAMATYNGAKYIQEQLDSFLEQTMLPDELIVTDDGSRDDTLAVVEAFASHAPFKVHVYRNERNLGYSKNFESAIGYCSGDIIFLSDQDDFWLPEKIRTITQVFVEDPEVWVLINDTEITDERLLRTGRSKARQVEALGLSSDSFITGCCTAFRKAMVPLICPVPDCGVSHDSWLHALGNVLGIRRLVPQVLQLYRRHDDNASQWLGSSKARLGRADQIKSYATRDPRPWCRQRLAQLVLLEERIRARRQVIAGLPKAEERFIKGVGEIERMRRASSKRLSLLERRRIERLIPACHMFCIGDYKYFSGWKSLAKDILVS